MAFPPAPDRLERLANAAVLRDLVEAPAAGSLGAHGGRRVRRLCISTSPAALEALHTRVVSRLEPDHVQSVDRELEAILEDIRRELAGARAPLGDRRPGIGDLRPDGSVDGRRVSGPLFARMANADGLLRRRRSVAEAATDPNEYFVHTLRHDEDPTEVIRDLCRLPGVLGVWSEPVHLFGPGAGLSQVQAAVAPIALGSAMLRDLGFDGRGVRIVVLEQGFQPHDDLPVVPVLMGTLLPAEAWHGTATLGVLSALPDRRGVTGLAPGAAVSLASPWREEVVRTRVAGRSLSVARVQTPEIADTLLHLLAAGHVGQGDILLIELQISPTPGAPPLPVDCFEPFACAVSHATACGVVVVEAAGNGGLDLDSVSAPHALRDTGALLVGAAGLELGPAASHRPLAGPFGMISNYGSLVVQYGPGERVTTTGGGPGSTAADAYHRRYSGTSSAAAVVAGGLAVLQSAWQARRPAGDHVPTRFDAFGLADWVLPRVGDEPAVVLGGRTLGVQADLRRVVRDTWNLTLRVHLEDTVGEVLPRVRGLTGEGAALTFGPACAGPDDGPNGGPWSAVARLHVPAGLTAAHAIRAVFDAFPAATLPVPSLRLRLPETTGVLLPGATAGATTELGPVSAELTALPRALVLDQDVRTHGAVCLLARLGADEDPMATDDDLANFWSYVYHLKYDPKLLVRQSVPGRLGADGKAHLPFYLAAAPGADVAFELILSVTRPTAEAQTLGAILTTHAKLTIHTDDTDASIALDPALVAAGGVFPDTIWHSAVTIARGVFPADALRPCVLTLECPGDEPLAGLVIHVAQCLADEPFCVGQLRWVF